MKYFILFNIYLYSQVTVCGKSLMSKSLSYSIIRFIQTRAGTILSNSNTQLIDVIRISTILITKIFNRYNPNSNH